MLKLALFKAYKGLPEYVKSWALGIFKVLLEPALADEGILVFVKGVLGLLEVLLDLALADKGILVFVKGWILGLFKVLLKLAIFKVNKGLPKFIKSLLKVLSSVFPKSAYWFLLY